MKSLILQIISPFLFSLQLQPAVGQPSPRIFTEKSLTPKTTIHNFKLGERVIQVKTYQYGIVKDMVYINLHDDEVTSINGAKKILEKKGGFLIRIENNKTRNIKFKLDGKYYTVDPNRMFSRTGIAQSLIVFGRTSPKAINEIEKFANKVLKLIPGDPTCIIALHNNSNGKYSVNSYLPGNLREKDAKQLHINPDWDADDMFLTTDSILFSRFVREKYNAVWQDNINAKKDGSLSIYCGENNLSYVNCETEHGQQEQYDEMIHTAVSYVERKNPVAAIIYNNKDVITYNYKLGDPRENNRITRENPVFFGERKVGQLFAPLDTTRLIAGKLEMDKNFRLYSNMDFYFFLSGTNSPRFEVRIDPTRARELVDPVKGIVNVKVVR